MDKEKEIKAYLDGELLPEVRMKYEIAEEMGCLLYTSDAADE